MVGESRQPFVITLGIPSLILQKRFVSPLIPLYSFYLYPYTLFIGEKYMW